MRILQVNSAQNLGGGETHVIELSQKLRDLGHQVLVAGRPNGPLNPEIAIPFRNSTDFLSALRLRKILRRQRIDIIHAHLARDYPIVAAAAWRVPNLKVIFTRHLLYKVTNHVLYRRVDGWLAPTSEILKTLTTLKPKRAAVIPNWVDLSKFKYRPHNLQSIVNIGLLGQISPHKGHDDAIAALRILGSEFRLIIAGQGEPKYVDTLKRRANDLCVEFIGFVPSADFLQKLDVLIVPSWHEPFGIVLLEAMAAGVPVISTLSGGPLDIIRSGEDGMLVPVQKPVELATAIRQLTDSAPMRLRMVAQARARVESEYDINKIVPRIERFYTEE